MEAQELLELAATATEIAGVLLILGGLVIASVRYALEARRGGGLSYQRYRENLGRAILLGLEVLVAADIVRTVAFTPTMSSVAVLAMIVAIRTFLSWSLALEIEGRWPWQRTAVPAGWHAPISIESHAGTASGAASSSSGWPRA